MYATDFEYAGQFLSDFGFIICSFGGSRGLETVSAGSEITFNKVSRNHGKIYSLVNTQYDGCVQASFQICKNPCVFNKQQIVSDEYREIIRWLNRKEFLDFQPFDAAKDDREEIHFKASFNVNKIILNDILCGLELIMETDKPFGYGALRNFKRKFKANEAGKVWTLRDYSDEIGSIYPKIVVTCNANGELKISNSDEGCEMIIKNCKKGEIITIDGDNQIISSSLPLESHDIAADFNYDFFRIGNSFAGRENKIAVSLPCELNIAYCPIIKDIP